MYKWFPYTIDGDQLCISFDYEEELSAFKAGIKKLKAFENMFIKSLESDRLKDLRKNAEKDGYYKYFINPEGTNSECCKITVGDDHVNMSVNKKYIFTSLELIVLTGKFYSGVRKIVKSHVLNINSRKSFNFSMHVNFQSNTDL